MDKRIFVTKPSLPPLDEYVKELRDIWNLHQLTNMGPKHELFRNQLSDYLGGISVELVVNGHTALELALQSLNLCGEVITTPYTFISTVHAIVRNGLTPVFCDIKPDDYTIDVSKIEALITDKTSAIMPVHVYGNICDVDEITRIANKYNLRVIYDAAHAFGESYRGKRVGEFGDITCLSFHATKVFNSIEGGAILFHDKEIGKKIYELKNFGIKNENEIVSIGSNAKMNEFSAAMGICNLRHFKEEVLKRKKIYERYDQRLEGYKGIHINHPMNQLEYNYSYFPIYLDEKMLGFNRDKLYDVLKENGIYTRKYFYPIASACKCYAEYYSDCDTPVALDVSRRILTLPMYADLGIDDVDRICDIIDNVISQSKG